MTRWRAAFAAGVALVLGCLFGSVNHKMGEVEMPIMSIEQALDNLEHAPSRGAINVDLEVRIANFQAAVQVDTARTIHEAVGALGDAMERMNASLADFTRVSDAGSQQLARWTQKTADATSGLRLATWALFTAMLLQIAVMWWAR